MLLELMRFQGEFGEELELLNKLASGDRRSIGKSNEVVADVIRDLSLFEFVFNGMLSDDPLIRVRSADAIEKIGSLAIGNGSRFHDGRFDKRETMHQVHHFPF